jgi:hypothetical protein
VSLSTAPVRLYYPVTVETQVELYYVGVLLKVELAVVTNFLLFAPGQFVQVLLGTARKLLLVSYKY